ncbi:hypothetical protein BDV11DRAFT_169184 [Aspergillus similis]
MKRIIVTGGSGVVGQHIVATLPFQGNAVLNLHMALGPSVMHTIEVDLTNIDVYSALASHFALTEPLPAQASSTPGAVIHQAGRPRNMLVLDNKAFQDNVVAMYDVLDAACRLWVSKPILASSVYVYGATYAYGYADFRVFPSPRACR